MSFETEVIERLTRVETKLDNVEQRHRQTRNMVLALAGAFTVAVGTIIAAILPQLV